MSLKKSEELLLEAIGSLLSQKARLGLPSENDYEETSHHSQYRWETIQEAFRLKIINSPFFDSMSSAFKQVHDYKYITHPTFKLALENELKGRGIPLNEIDTALKAVDTLVEGCKKDENERSSGWNPNMKDLVDVTTNADTRTAKPSKPFTGGGPIPEHAESVHDDHYIMLEGFSQIKKSKRSWPIKQKHLIKLSIDARDRSMYTLAESIDRYIIATNTKTISG